MSRKSTLPEGNIKGDAAKFFCYREAWTRIGLAREHGFPFEAIAIIESILADRLSRYLAAAGSIGRSGHESLGELVRRWRRVYPDAPSQGKFADLRFEVDQWREARNRAVHGIVRCPANAAVTRIDDFLAAAVVAAEDGSVLARALSDWCEKMLRSASNARGPIE